uniref:Obscurin-like protein 1 n=2 Tax=Oreochromis TaxID=8139 RepID=A0A669EC84_ORENI
MDIFGGAPRVLGYPRPVVAQCGTDATLKCQVGGDPRPDVIWERKNVQILSEGRYKISEEGKVYLLTITRVTQQDAGQYICKARNSIGETYAAASLKVEGEAQQQDEDARQLVVNGWNSGPRFLIKPLSLRVDRGEDAAFSCKIWGTPLPEVIWEKDGKKLNDIFESSHFSMRNEDGGWFQLKIYRTRMPDKGVYTCKAVNCHGEALAGAVLLVEPVPERGDSKTSSTVKKFAVAEGKHAKFRCFVTGKPKPEIIWKKDGVPLEPDRRHLIFEDREGYYTLKVLYCKVQDTGLYVCAASNALGNTLSAVHLSVKGPAVRFRRPLKDVEVKERDVAVLECEVPDESLPAAWYLEDQRLMPSSKYGMEQKGTKRRLTIHDVGTDDDGVYLCEMPDGAKSIAELSVKGTIVRKLPRKLEVLEGENAAFCVEVENDDMEVHWFKDGLKLHETHQTILKSFGKTHILVFVNVAYHDSGVVTFVAGRSKTSSRLKVKATRHCPPICPVGVKMDVDRPNSALLTWDPAPSSQTSTRSVFVLEMQEVGSQEWQKCFTSETATSAEVTGDIVPCEGNYRFRVCCINKYGRSGHVEFPNVVHLVPGPKILSRLQSCEVVEGQDARFSIELSAPMVGTWFLNSAQLQHGGRYSIQHNQTKHSVVIHESRMTEDEAEVTFIANGVRDSAVLNVKRSPLSELDSKKKVDIGDAIVLYCEVSHPFAKVSWFKDGKELQVSDGLNIQADGNMRRIVIQSAEESHSGVYTCETSGDVITFNVDVAGPPVEFSPVAEDELHKSSMELDPVVLVCHVSRDDAEVVWYKDGCEIKPSDNITLQAEGTMRRLIIRSAETSDAGSYTCQAGSSSMEFTVNVRVMIVEPKDDVVMESYISEEIHLQCELSRSRGKVRWFKDGLQVAESENIQLISEGPYRRLTILCSSEEDAGEYVCETDGDSVFFQLGVKDPPVRIIYPSESELELTHLASERLELSCEISKADAPVRWFKDGLEVEAGHNLILEVDGAQRRLIIPITTVHDMGEYVCDTEDDSLAFLVTITEPPVTLTCAKDTADKLESLAGKPVILEIEVSRPNAEVKWLINGEEIQQSSNVTITEDGLIRRLTIHAPIPEDSGKYTCDAMDDKIDFQVKVSEPPVKILRKSEIKNNQKFLISDDIVLECELSRANAAAKWYKDGCRVQGDERFCEEEEGPFRSLVILNPSDSGKYVCDAVDDKMVSVIRIQETPVTFVNKEDDIVVTGYEAESVTLTSYVSKESVLVRWMKDWTTVEGDRYRALMEGHKRTLTIEPLRRSDAGEYTCDINTDQMHFSLLFTKPLRDTVAHADGMVTLRCEVCKPKADVQWLRNGVEVVPNRRFSIRADGVERSLTIHRLSREDAGEYTCESRDDRTVAKLRVEIIEFLTELHNTTVLEGEDATFKCVVSPEDVQLVWLMDNEPITLGDRFQATHNGLCHTLVIKKCQMLDCSKITRLRLCLLRKWELLWQRSLVQWMRQGVVIQSGPRHTLAQNGCKRSLTIHNLTLSDRGTYRCETLHDRTQVKLNVEPRKIAIRKGLTDQETFERETASFVVELSHTDVEGSWQKDGIRVKPNNQCRVSTNGRVHGLTLSNLTLEDTGTIVFSAEGVRTTARLTVKETPVSILKPLADARDLNFSICSFRGTSGGGTTLERAERAKDHLHTVGKSENCCSLPGTKHFLLMCNVKAEDAGEIRFVARDVESTAYLEVEELPVSIVKPLRDRTALEKHRVILECTVSSPHCSATWYKGREELVSSDRLEILADGCSHKLVIQQVSVEDEGTYSIEVGEHTSKAKLMVEGKLGRKAQAEHRK